jgi:hypothetical protein
MPATYSINVGSALEAYRKPDIISVLKDLPDNTHKLIKPRNVRDAFLSTWAASPFKQTTNLAGTEYIGIDSGNPANRDIKQKILLGKRSYANLDVMTDSLLAAERADIYIYNTKPDSYLTQSSTKVAILAGTAASLHESAPYIESRIESGNNHLEIRNPSPFKGPISIFSSSGRVAINGILFPTVAENSAGATDGKILKYSGTYPNGYFKWSPITFDQTNVGAAGLPTNIYGSPVKLNGYSLEFVDSSIVPAKVGGVPSGFSFSSNSFYNITGATYQNWPLVEVLRKIIYPYTPPVLSLSIANAATGTTYAEANSVANVTLTYNLTIYPRTSAESVSNYYILYRDSYIGGITTTQSTTYHSASFSGIPGKTFSASIPFQISSGGASEGGTYTYTMAISDVPGTVIAGYPVSGGGPNIGWSYSSTATMNFIKPIYYGFSGLTQSKGFLTASYALYSGISLQNYQNNNLYPLFPLINKLVKPFPGLSASMKLSISGSGYLYFIYPRSNGIGGNLDESNLLWIKDPNGFIIYQRGYPEQSAFRPGTFDANDSPQSGKTPYVMWESKRPCSYQGDGQFEIAFGPTASFSWPAPPPAPPSFGPVFDPGGFGPGLGD